MGIFGKKAPATELDFADVAPAERIHAESPTFDSEKGYHQDIENSGLPAHHVHHVDPEAEKKYVRKLDKRLVPIVVGLCM